MIQAVIRPLVWVVVLGYLTLWIMMPTNTYRNRWSTNIKNKVNSTYFGPQGVEVLLYTFPILFVAALGCVHLHLSRGSDGNYNKLKRMNRLSAWWKKPMLVNGPLGIVSAMELAFLVMFVALLIWSFSIYTRNFFALTPQYAAITGEKVWEAKLGMVAFILGVVGNIGLALLFFPVARGSSVLPLFGLASEGSIKYHIWLGHTVMTLFTAHGIVYIIYWALTNQISETLKWAKTGLSNVAGEISLVAGLGLWATTFPRVRTKMFELFFYTHYLYILFMVFFIFHVGISYSFIMLPGFYLFLIDRYLRFLQSRQRVRLVSARILPCETLELIFSKTPGLRYSPTSILFMNVPCISKLQWHPFTINSSSNMESDQLSVVIKGEGSWSKKLYQIVSSPSRIGRLEVSIEGPYGPASTHFLRHDTLVMVSGGSGITPFISIIRDLISTGATENFKTPQVLLICAFKNSSDLTMLDLLLPIAGTPSTVPSLQLRIEAYVTREKQPTSDHSKLVRTKWFKPHEKDEPMYPLLGPNSWLYLGAIISSSFIIFLIIIGLITRYYIYPIDHNTDIVFSLSLRAVLYMLVMCICIALTAGAAVMWNKRANAREAKQIQNLEAPSPAGSSESVSNNDDRELESLPHQSLVQATTVHYGERPDLKKILSECKGSSSVGVLTCGPKKLRHDVASICGSGVVDNLHFKSISFSW